MAKPDQDAPLLLEYRARNELDAQTMSELVADTSLDARRILEAAEDIFWESQNTERALSGAAGRQKRPESRALYRQAVTETRLAMVGLLESFIPTLDRIAPLDPARVVGFIESNAATLHRVHEDRDVLARQKEVEAKIATISAKALLAWPADRMTENWLHSAQRTVRYMPPALQQEVLAYGKTWSDAHPGVDALQTELQRAVSASANTLTASP